MESETAQPFDPPVATISVNRSRLRSFRFWIPAIVCAMALVAVPIAFIVGAVIGNTQIYRNSSEHQQTRIEQYLSQHPESFADISVEHASNGWAYPLGTVSSQSDFDMLAAKLHEMFGDELDERMMNSVELDTAN